MGATATTTAAAVKQFIDSMVDTHDYAGTPLMDLFPKTPSVSDSSYRWNVKYGLNLSSTTFNEGDSISAAGNTLTATAAVAYSTNQSRTIFSITGTAKDNAKSGYFDLMQDEAAGALQAHMHSVEDLLVTQLTGAVDNGGSYGGLTRSTYKLASTEAASSTLTLAELQLEWETMAAVQNAANMANMIKLSGVDMQAEYADIATGVAYFEMAPTQGILDAGKLGKVLQYNGRPWVTIPTMTAGTILTLDPADIKLIEHRPVTIEQLAKTKDEDVFAITSNYCIVHRNPRKAGKIT